VRGWRGNDEIDDGDEDEGHDTQMELEMRADEAEQLEANGEHDGYIQHAFDYHHHRSTSSKSGSALPRFNGHDDRGQDEFDVQW